MVSTPAKVAAPSSTDAPQATPPALPAGQHDRCNRESFRNLVQEDGQKNDPSQPVGNQEAGGDGDAVEKRMDDQSDQNRVSPVAVDKLRLCGFLLRNGSEV